MSEDVRTADAAAQAERVLEQFRAWQRWRQTLEKDPQDWQAFRRDMVGTGATAPGTDFGFSEVTYSGFGIANLESIGSDEESFAAPDQRRYGGVDVNPVSGARIKRLALADSPIPSDPLAVARARGEQMQRDILASQGEMLDAEQVASRLGIGPAEVEQQRQDGLLLGLPLEGDQVGFPAWQFTDAELLPGLEDALRDLNVHGPWSRVAFFLSGDLRLNGRTPLEALLLGEVDAVRGAAAAYGEQLAS